MGDAFKSKFAQARTKFLGARRSSATSEVPSSSDNRNSLRHQRLSDPKHKTSFPELPVLDHRSLSAAVDGSEQELTNNAIASQDSAVTHGMGDRRESVTTDDRRQSQLRYKSSVPPLLTVQEPSPDLKATDSVATKDLQARPPSRQPRPPPTPTPLSRTFSSGPRSPFAGSNSSHSHAPTTPHTRDTEYEISGQPGHEIKADYFGPAAVEQLQAKMPRRRIWIRRPGASATQVQVAEDDLVDDLRDMIIRKYSNALGRTFDAPDITLRIIPRAPGPGTQERALGPDESLCQTVEGFFPGGQSVDEALMIDVPARRTPRPSPGLTRPMYLSDDVHHPVDDNQGYFPPMPIAGSHGVNSDPRTAFQNPAHPHSMSIIETGQIPPLPSPRAKGSYRPRAPRQRTASPTIITGTPNVPVPLPQNRHHRRLDSGSGLSKVEAHAPNPPPLPTPPASELPPPAGIGLASKVATPPVDRVTSPRAGKAKRRNKNSSSSSNAAHTVHPTLPAGMLNSSVPPINVLIVEDNIINLKLLEAFVKRLKVRWATAMNGREAVEKWRTGGFHLVLMDIQLPIMSGLQATKEIRRLERVNGIGVFAKSEGEDRAPQSARVNGDARASAQQLNGTEIAKAEHPEGEDRLAMLNLFKSPVIIVALTASSLQSDRHEALAAGCNDFLTKPVNFVWFERKVMEWGCMQALIDFDGWRQWKNFDGAQGADSGAEQRKKETPAEREKRELKEARKLAVLTKMGKA
ncbi:MAG: ssk1 response regulator receiver [Chrysothrix sp. TS-e1954]|nr:MAG: ssk1 response regulator receiver [Chrysothrix sp. TS-e1954]